VLDAATDLFLARGFAGTSMDAIAARAGVSKLTVYAHFEDKDRLFQAIVRERCESYNRPESFERSLALAPREALREMGGNFLALLLSPQTLGLYRVMIAEASRRPKIAELFYTAGPERLASLFADYFRRAAARGQYRIDDPEQAADHFLSLVKGKLHFRATLSLGPPPTRVQAAAHVAGAVDLFLRAYARRRAR
jgi:TetR/AcrR family transcriptional repressor of mexJK operon